MKTLGLDLAASPLKTGACEIDWDAGTVRLLPRPQSDEDLVIAIAAVDRCGLDVPLGWPDAFVAGLAAHHLGDPWPELDPERPSDRVPLRFRLTDRIQAAGGGRWPLSVSTDLIGVPALRAARIQHLLREAGVAVDRSGSSGRIAEVYPAAALRRWGLTSRGYKGPKNRAVGTALAQALAARCGPLAAAVGDALAGADDDDLDALVCALLARAVHVGRTTAPAEDQLDVARREGWIHVPLDDLEDLVHG